MKMRIFFLLGCAVTVASGAVGLCLLYAVDLIFGPAAANNQIVLAIVSIIAVCIVSAIGIHWCKRSYRAARRREKIEGIGRSRSDARDA